jgi:16S rRNA (uracil1498-N3)-methyltransferase
VFVESVEHPVLAPDDRHHLLRVLRLRDGEAVGVSDGLGAWRITSMSSGELIPVGEVRHEPPPVPCRIAVAIPKGDRCDWMVQKLTELGVTDLWFVHCARSVVRWEGERGVRQLDRMRRVAREAAMQSRRTWLPNIEGPVRFSEAAAMPSVVLADPDGEALPAGATVLVGPEGGFAPEEAECVPAKVRLASGVLRVETAAVAAAVLLVNNA